MLSLKLIRDHVVNAPVALILSGVAILFLAMPDFGNAFEFHFSDLQWNIGSTESSNFTWPSSWIRALQSGLRTLGCNWLHWSIDHLCWDLFMFYLVGSLCEQRNRSAFLAVTFASGLMIPITVMIYSPEFGSYRGLSGIDTALYALLGTLWFLDAIRERDRSASLVCFGLLVAMVLKIGYELISQQLLFVTDDSFTPAPTAHSSGAIIGILIALCFVAKDHAMRRQSGPRIVHACPPR